MLNGKVHSLKKTNLSYMFGEGLQEKGSSIYIYEKKNMAAQLRFAKSYLNKYSFLEQMSCGHKTRVEMFGQSAQHHI